MTRLAQGALDLAAHEALRMQLACIVGEEPPSSYFELRPLTRDGRPARREFIPVSDAQQAVEMIGERACTLNMFVGAAPRIRKDGTAAAVARVWQLWLDLDRPDALDLIGDFRPLPSLIISTGSPGHALAHWPLDTPLGPAQAQRANRRLAARLDGDMAATDPARILRAVGSLNHKHRPPVEVTCTRVEPVRFTAAQVVGGLPDSDHYRPRPPAPPREHVNGDAALDGLARVVRSAEVGSRNARLFWSACRALEHADAGHLDEHQALGELRAAGLHVGLGEQEITATIRSALRQRTRTAA